MKSWALGPPNFCKGRGYGYIKWAPNHLPYTCLSLVWHCLIFLLFSCPARDEFNSHTNDWFYSAKVKGLSGGYNFNALFPGFDTEK